jgi:hypothetical protein
LSHQKQERFTNTKPYDRTLKAIFGEQAEEVIPCLVPGARLREDLLEDELNVEVNRTTLSIDLGYGILYKGKITTLNLEGQSSKDDDLLPRMLEYAIHLYRKYKKRPVLSVGLFLFKCQVPEIPFQIICGDDDVCIEFRPIIICMWQMDPQMVVERQQRCLYHLLPTMNRPSVDLLKQALREMHEHDDPEQFGYHVEWFDTMLSRTTTVSDEDKNIIKEHLRMQYQLHPLLAENPTIQSVIAEGIAEGIAKGEAEIEARGEAEGEARGIAKGLQDGIIQGLQDGIIQGLQDGIIQGLQDGIVDLINDHFSAQVVTRVQQTIALARNIGQLRKLLPQIARAADEEEVYTLLSQYFPVQEEEVKGEIKGIRVSILDITGARFSAQVVTQVQQAIAPIQDMELLRKFLRQLACLSHEQEVLALLERCFPVQ